MVRDETKITPPPETFSTACNLELAINLKWSYFIYGQIKKYEHINTGFNKIKN